MAVKDVMYTYNPNYDYEYSWTIEKFSISPDVLQGPSISVVPGFTKNLNFQLTFTKGRLIVFLINNVKDSHLVVSGNTSFCNTNDDILHETTIETTGFRGSISLLDYPIYFMFTKSSELSYDQSNLLEDKLVVKGKLSFSGYAIYSNVSPVSVNEDSEACSDLSKDLKTMYESGLSSDVTFLVGGKPLRAHKIILLNRSPVFAKMFNSNMLEGNSNKVVIKDADYHAFNCFLMFLYTGIVEDKKWDIVLSLYSLAHKYQVKSLHEICSGILGRSLAIDSACNILVLSDLHGDEELKNIAKVFIVRHIFQLAGTNEWIELATTKPQLVKDVLSSVTSPTTMK